MSDIAIRVENLGKKYLIRHAVGRHRYVALRDVIAEKCSSLFRRDGSRRPDATREEFWALREVSFEIRQGEVVGIIGRNGAGKSTLLKLLSRITVPTEGRIEIEGRIGSLLEVGTGFHPELTGRENVFLNGAILGMTRLEIKRKFDEIVAFAEIERFLDTPVKRYSSGMYVRLAFAVAAHLDPEILVVDEVLAVGDAEFQKKCLGKMQSVARNEGRTVLFVSHNMAAVRQLSGSGIVLEKGAVKFRGGAADAIEIYSGLAREIYDVSFEPRGESPCITSVSVDPAGLAVGDLRLSIGFRAPSDLNPPIPGFVMYSASGVPVVGSNPRFQREGFKPAAAREGRATFAVSKLPLRSGRYHLSVWLGDWHSDFDHRADALAFEFRPGQTAPNTPSSDLIGYLECSGTWEIEAAGAENRDR